MDSLDAQCLLLQLAYGEGVRPPDPWRHERSGALTFAYAGSERSFTWPAEEVAQLVRRWRELEADEVAEPVRFLREAHAHLGRLIRGAGLDPPDEMIHDLSRAELRMAWHDEKIVLVIDELGRAPADETLDVQHISSDRVG
jgi:hypothetical protein